MSTVKDVAAADFIPALSAHIKKSKNLKIPMWMEYAKSATFNELSPADPDFYYVHMAAIARHVYLRKGVGVGDLRKRFGGRARRGNRPNKSAVASGSLQRKSLQTLEKLNWVKKTKTGGREMTSVGRRELDSIAYKVIVLQRQANELNAQLAADNNTNVALVDGNDQVQQDNMDFE